MTERQQKLDNVHPFAPRSIQGEQLGLDAELFMDQADVDAYVEKVSEEVLACRERARHLFPRTRKAEPLVFTDVTDEGLFVRKRECEVCGCGVRVELWEAFRRSGQIRYRMVSAYTTYKTNTNGETYLAPVGRGRMAPRQVREALASTAMSGVQPAALKKKILAERTAEQKRRAARKPKKDTQGEGLFPRFNTG